MDAPRFMILIFPEGEQVPRKLARRKRGEHTEVEIEGVGGDEIREISTLGVENRRWLAG